MATNRSRRRYVIAGIVIGLLAGGALIGAVFPKVFPAAPASSATPTPEPFVRASFDAYWAGVLSPATRGLVTSVDWSDGVLTAHTKLFARPEAVEPATKICQALSAYWPEAGQVFQPVRVVDGAEQILVSRRSADDTCAWRR